MIAIVVVASLVAYAWVMGYIGFNTSKSGDAITLQSFAATDYQVGTETKKMLTIYVQNTGQGAIQLNPHSSVYVDDKLVEVLEVDGEEPEDMITIAQGTTVALLLNCEDTGKSVTIKVVTTGGTFCQITGKAGTGGDDTNAGPIAAFTSAPNGLVVQFTDTSYDTYGTIASREWDFDDGATSTEQNPSHTYGTSGTYSVSLTVTDNEGATNTVSHDVQVQAAQTMSATISPSGTVTKIAGETQTFTSTVNGGTGAISYQWYLDDAEVTGASGIGSSYTYTAQAAGSPHSVYLRVTDSAETVQSNTASVVVNTALVAPTINANPATVNRGSSSSLTSTAVTTGVAPYTYHWLQRAPGAGSYTAITGADSASYTFTTTGSTATGSLSFQLQVTDSASQTVTSTATTVTVNTALVAPTVSANPTSVNQGSSSSLTSTAVTTGTAPYTYQWIQRAPGASSYSDISGANTASYTFATSSSTATGEWSFQLKVTDNTGATVTSSNAATVTVNAAPTQTMHVSSIVVTIENSGMFDLGERGRAVATIVDSNGNAISGATVYGTWSEAVSGTVHGDTASNGQYTVTSDTVYFNWDTHTFTFTVTNVVKTGWTYDSSANVVSSGTRTG